MKTLTLSASRLRYGSWLRLTSTMRPSAGESTAAGSSGASRGGSRKNCRMKALASQHGADHQAPKKKNTSTEMAKAMPRNGQPSRAMIGCGQDRKSTRLNSSHSSISYAVFCLKKKKKQ